MRPGRSSGTKRLPFVPPRRTYCGSPVSISTAAKEATAGSIWRTAGELKDVDLAGLFEVRATPWSSSPDQAEELGKRLGLRSAFLATEHRWWHDQFGNAVLLAVPIAGIRRLPLIGTRGKAFRQAVLIDVPLKNAMVRVVMVHVDRERDRERQLAAVIRLFQSLESPAVLMGDLNSGIDDPQLASLLSQPGVESVLHAQLGADAPTNNIDWIITRGLESIGATYAETGASDHPVVKAELRLPKGQ